MDILAPRRAAAPAVQRDDHLQVLAVVLLWQVAMTLCGALLDPGTGRSAAANWLVDGLLGHTFRGDSEWFNRILTQGYQGDPRISAFYPLFPLCVDLVRLLGLGQVDALGAAWLLNTVATWLAVLALLRIARGFCTQPATPWLVVAGLLTVPGAFFLHMFSSEALFVALGFWAYLFALRGQWARMALCLIPLTACRLTAVLFVVLCFLEFWRACGWRPRALLSRRLLWFPVSFLGFAGYAAWLALSTGDALGMVGRQLGSAWEVFAAGHWQGFGEEVVPLAGLVLLAVASVYLISALGSAGVPLAVFGLASFVVVAVNSDVVSVHRDLVPCLGMYVALGVLWERRPSWRPATVAALMLGASVQISVLCTIVAGSWAG
ncbi:hypothetical protein [Kutzneria albida]|uniref:Uncharacterized protein n=1 Tax=Kutzneria albida DSM 43870 TaxID=1449976 RepID=W5W0V8_9PSEU|nr:hypothetical protein [Kutzneria albida]AHH94808.1 hypothetical protein KALB_1435 [Kutzneria albida DSM 43870]